MLNRPLFWFFALVLVIAAPQSSRAQVTATNLATILAEHNAARCDVSPPAVTMPELVWDPVLAQVAQNYANQGVFEHNGNRTSEYAALGGSGYVGENIAAGNTGLEQLIALWT